jgi:hypothetical protein
MKKLFLLFLLLGFTACNSSDESAGTDSGSTDDGVSTIPTVTADCRVNTICATGGDAVGKTGRIAFIKDACADFGSGSTLYALGETTSITCDSDNCEFTINSWTANSQNITTLSDGPYNVVMYIDTDTSGTPSSNDPFRCIEGHSVGSSSTSISEVINAQM